MPGLSAERQQRLRDRRVRGDRVVKVEMSAALVERLLAHYGLNPDEATDASLTGLVRAAIAETLRR